MVKSPLMLEMGTFIYTRLECKLMIGYSHVELGLNSMEH